jgi:hypothetical protein
MTHHRLDVPQATDTVCQQLDSAFQLQEHLAALHYHHTRGNTVPITRETAKLLATPPPGIDRTLWLYELCRFLIAQCNSLIVGFLFDTPPCSAATCPEMRASEWQFLCAVHDAPKSCCAIDYCCHTLDWAANVVTNPKIFPSRFVAPLSDGHDKGAALKNLVNVFRRLHRIFAHAWFQHRGVFWSVEGQTGLYVFFKTVCDLYDLLPAENYKLPPEAEGLEAPTTGIERQPSAGGGHPLITSIARPPSAVERASGDDDNFASAAARTNTRRHIRSNPSTGNAISMVPEVDEDDHDQGLEGRMRNLKITSMPNADTSTSNTSGGLAKSSSEKQTEAEMADVPVIVLDEARPSASRRETVIETRETTEQDNEDERESGTRPDGGPVSEDKPSEAEAESVVLENELEKPVPGPSVNDNAGDITTEPKPGDVKKEEAEEEDEEVGEETVISHEEGNGDEPAEAELQPEEAEPELPPVSADKAEDLEGAVEKDDPAAAAAVVAANEAEADRKEEESAEDEGAKSEDAEKSKETKSGDDKSDDEKLEDEKSKEDEDKDESKKEED